MRDHEREQQKRAVKNRPFTPGEYCPRCRSRLYPVDRVPMESYGVCSYCVTWAMLLGDLPKK